MRTIDAYPEILLVVGMLPPLCGALLVWLGTNRGDLAARYQLRDWGIGLLLAGVPWFLGMLHVYQRLRSAQRL